MDDTTLRIMNDTIRMSEPIQHIENEKTFFNIFYQT